MDFFGIGPWEILLIIIVALIVVGPGKIPEIARTSPRFMASNNFLRSVIVNLP